MPGLDMGGPPSAGRSLIRDKMATVIQKADELFQLNRNFEAEIEEVRICVM